jgi:hypothetical protein
MASEPHEHVKAAATTIEQPEGNMRERESGAREIVQPGANQRG